MFFLFFFRVDCFLNGALTVEIAVFGLVISAAMYLFICKFMNYSIHKDIAFGKRGLGIFRIYMRVDMGDSEGEFRCD